MALLIDELSGAQTQVEAANQQLVARKQQLTHERTKLLQAHYAGAVPLELLKTEQDRITTQLEAVESKLEATAVEFETVRTNLRLALDLAAIVTTPICGPAIRPGGC